MSLISKLIARLTGTAICPHCGTKLGQNAYAANCPQCQVPLAQHVEDRQPANSGSTIPQEERIPRVAESRISTNMPSAETARKIKAEHDAMIDPGNMTKDAKGMVTDGGNVAFQIGSAYRRLRERYKQQLCSKYAITPDVLQSIIDGRFEPKSAPFNSAPPGDD